MKEIDLHTLLNDKITKLKIPLVIIKNRNSTSVEAKSLILLIDCED